MAHRIIIFTSTGEAKLVIDWRHNRIALQAVMERNMQAGDIAVEVTPSSPESLCEIKQSAHRCRAAVHGLKITDIHFMRIRGESGITVPLFSSVSKRQWRKCNKRGSLFIESRRSLNGD